MQSTSVPLEVHRSCFAELLLGLWVLPGVISSLVQDFAEFQEFPISLFLPHSRDPSMVTATSQVWWSPWTWICLVLMTHKRTVALFQWMFTFLIRSQTYKSGSLPLCAKYTWNSRKFNTKIPGRHFFLAPSQNILFHLFNKMILPEFILILCSHIEKWVQVPWDAVQYLKPYG